MGSSPARSGPAIDRDHGRRGPTCGGLPRRAELALLRLPGKHRHEQAHQRASPACRAVTDTAGRRASSDPDYPIINNGANLAPFDRSTFARQVHLFCTTIEVGFLPLHARGVQVYSGEHRGGLGARRRSAAGTPDSVVRGATLGRRDPLAIPAPLRAGEQHSRELLWHQSSGRGSQLLRYVHADNAVSSSRRVGPERDDTPGLINSTSPNGETIGFTRPASTTLAVRVGDDEEDRHPSLGAMRWTSFATPKRRLSGLRLHDTPSD